MRGLFKPFLRVLAAMMLALGIGSAAHGAVPLEGCFASLPPASGDAERVLAPPPVWDCTSPQNRLGTGDFAARLLFAPVKADPANPLVLRFASVWQDRAKFVFRYADGTTASLAFSSWQASRYMTIGAIFELPVPTHKAPLTAIHVEIKDSANLRGIVLGATLMTRSEADRLTGWLIALYAGFAGLILALVVYNLAFWVALRHRFQLVYALMAASLAAYTFTSSGAALLVFSNLDNNDRLRINYLLLYFSGVLGLAFIRAFFGRAVFTLGSGAIAMWSAASRCQAVWRWLCWHPGSSGCSIGCSFALALPCSPASFRSSGMPGVRAIAISGSSCFLGEPPLRFRWRGLPMDST